MVLRAGSEKTVGWGSLQRCPVSQSRLLLRRPRRSCRSPDVSVGRARGAAILVAHGSASRADPDRRSPARLWSTGAGDHAGAPARDSQGPARAGALSADGVVEDSVV